MSEGLGDWRRAMLIRGGRNLSALKRTVVKPTISPAGKKTMGEMIIKQAAFNERLLKGMTFEEGEMM